MRDYWLDGGKRIDNKTALTVVLRQAVLLVYVVSCC